MTRALVGLLVVLLLAPAVAAHANPARVSPAPGERLADAPDEVWIQFSEPPDPATLQIRVENRSGGRFDVGAARVERDTHAHQRLHPEMPEDVYVVRWETVSAADGHRTKGSWAFVLGNGTAPAGQVVEAAPLGYHAVVGKVGMFLGFALVAGAAAFRAFVLPAGAGVPAWMRRWAVVGAFAHLASLALFAAGQASSAGEGVAAYFAGTTFGKGLVARLGVAVLLVAWASGVPAARRRTGDVLGLVLVLVGGLAHGLFSHTAASFSRVGSGAALDAAHLLAVSVWAGGLACLWRSLAASGAPAEDLDAISVRFSRLATSCLAVLAVSAVPMLVAVLGADLGAYAAFDDRYVQVLYFKVVAGILMVGVGAANRFVFLPRTLLNVPDARRAFRANVRREVAIGIAVFLAAGLLTNLSPALGETGSPVQAPLVIEGMGAAFHVTMSVAPPPAVGTTSAYEIRILDHSTGEAVTDAIRVRAEFAHADDPDLGSTAVLAAPGPDMTYLLSGSFFARPGNVIVTLTIQTPDVYEDRFRIEMPVG
ncbi:MAG: copper resistance CopC/CopD family protein [Methanobacteriota archaeon]